MKKKKVVKKKALLVPQRIFAGEFYLTPNDTVKYQDIKDMLSGNVFPKNFELTTELDYSKNRYYKGDLPRIKLKVFSVK